MSSGCTINSVFVIESLRSPDLRTGERLFENVLKPLEQKLGIVKFRPVSDKAVLFATLRIIEDEAKAGLFPILDLECHACEDGLKLLNDERVPWYELKPYLQAINRATRNNLFVVAAACYGYSLGWSIEVGEQAPYFAMLGPVQSISGGELEADLELFYRSLSAERNLDKAILELNTVRPEMYKILSCESILIEAYQSYLKHHCNKKRLSERLENMISSAKFRSLAKNQSLTTLRKKMKSLLRQRRDYFSRIRNHFLMIDISPANEERFQVSRDFMNSLPT